MMDLIARIKYYLFRAQRRLGPELKMCAKITHRYSYSIKKILKPKRNRVISQVGNTKESWENAFVTLWEPIIERFSKGKALVKIDGPQIGSAGKICDGYEGFAWTFIGAAFYLHQKKDSVVSLSNGAKVDMAAIYREGIINGTNPRHREYWGKIKSTEKLVENASVAAGLLLTREHIWDKLSREEKNNVTKWFAHNVSEHFYMNNWQWFKVFHYVFLEQTGYEIDSEDLERTLENIEKMYHQAGWYSDGIDEEQYHYDYYVPWTMHFFSLLFCYLAGEGHNEWKQKYIKRARQFSRDYQYFLTPQPSSFIWQVSVVQVCIACSLGRFSAC
jgi:hypothetical protein